ncbi:MAG: hypothetical protein WAX69_08635, partial [Victivallales bacterium]
RLKSLHQFIYAKRSGLAVRFNTETASFTKNTSQMPDGTSVEYSLLSLPLYMAEELRRIIGIIARDNIQPLTSKY